MGVYQAHLSGWSGWICRRAGRKTCGNCRRVAAQRLAAVRPPRTPPARSSPTRATPRGGPRGRAARRRLSALPRRVDPGTPGPCTAWTHVAHPLPWYAERTDKGLLERLFFRCREALLVTPHRTHSRSDIAQSVRASRSPCCGRHRSGRHALTRHTLTHHRPHGLAFAHAPPNRTHERTHIRSKRPDHPSSPPTLSTSALRALATKLET